MKMMEAHGREGRGDLAGTQGTPGHKFHAANILLPRLEKQLKGRLLNLDFKNQEKQV